MQILLNIDVADLGSAIGFYRDALGLRHARTLFEGTVAEMLGACCRVYLIEHAERAPLPPQTKPAGTLAATGRRSIRISSWKTSPWPASVRLLREPVGRRQYAISPGAT